MTETSQSNFNIITVAEVLILEKEKHMFLYVTHIFDDSADR